MRRVLGFAIAGIAASAVAAPAAGAAGVPDASCTANTGVTIVQNNGDLKVAQTFAAIHSGRLDTAQMTVTNKAGSTPGDWRLEIASATGTGPGGVLATTTVPNTLANGAQGVITGTFATPATVTAGGSYAVLVSRPGSSGYQVTEQGGDPCPGQQGFYQNVVSGPFIEDPFVDFGFAVTVELPNAQASPKCKKKKHKKHAHAAKKKHKKCGKKKRK
jgi:hypothetical protein